ncbi:hypothetical protein BD324DRAFT_638880 [Kockovaella imperatae]|uniref:RRM domain-containing protein n=1 Tax=Kockovaella imperatae TaxID=4999 RepID=A0A1Y1U769_9TREE|nr:hypothetical protein BD324DRAFT_638880 [Kockovaella imperatae]ORX33852.1 hypothetical protein BD324DRAFT_638880 [Kockovaella imperatae]
MSAEQASNNAAQIAGDIPTEDAGYRVYVGNLSYKATEEEVREFMSKAGGEILSVVIPLKFKRPAGYAFVSFKNEADAKNAVEKLDGQELGERKLALQVARSREEQAERRQAHVEKREAAKAARESKKAAAGEANGEAAEEGKQKKPKRASRRRQPGEADDDEPEAEANGDGADAAEKPKKAPKARKPKAPAQGRIDDKAGENGEVAEKKPRERKPRQPKLELTGEMSSNTIFVANLPFSVDDEALSAIFTNLSIRVKSAKVVRGSRRGRGGRPYSASRGFGFVEVEDPAQQAEAVEKAEGSLVGDRKISAKIAREMKPIEMEQVAEAQEGTAW